MEKGDANSSTQDDDITIESLPEDPSSLRTPYGATTNNQRSQSLLGERFPILERKSQNGGSTLVLLSTTPLDEEINATTSSPDQSKTQRFTQWLFINYKAFSVTWIGEDVSPVRILYILIFFLSMNLLTLISLYSLSLTLLLTCFVGLAALAFFFWSLLKNKIFLGAWMVLVPVLLTLGICVSSIYFNSYVTITRNNVHDISVVQAVNYPSIDVFYFVDGSVNVSLVGEYSVQVSKDEVDYFCVAPVVPVADWTLFNPITLWAACRTTTPCATVVSSNSTDPCLTLWRTLIREGVSVWPSEMIYFDIAKNDSLQSHPYLSASPSAPTIFWQNPSQVLEKYREVGTDTLAAMNAVWILLSIISFSYLFKRYYLGANKYMAI
eukprot:TRINITY_DN16356_c0_g1_i1.p1 TRINITY_DN16356_c0_g1~~TRINITY_DN16356_c0_g1_i1.p1  ORF type:complete len:380 (-),score=53.21 TRINITY_DN16356_c0_g1_i1:61-1200(-)